MSSNDHAAAAAHEKDTAVNGGGSHQHHSIIGHHGDYAHMAKGQNAEADGGAMQVGNWKPYEHRKLANPAPLGLSAFALTTFVLSLLNFHTRGMSEPNIVVSLAFGYGGLVQLLAGMWYVLF